MKRARLPVESSSLAEGSQASTLQNIRQYLHLSLKYKRTMSQLLDWIIIYRGNFWGRRRSEGRARSMVERPERDVRVNVSEAAREAVKT